MPLATPALEAWFNAHEAGAEHSLGGTMVQTWPGTELARYLPEGWGVDRFEFHYVATPGSRSTRSLIAADYGLAPEGVMLAVGATEANHTVLRGLLGPGAKVVLQDPLYYAFEGLARDLGADVATWSVPADPAIAPDWDALLAQIDDSTRLVVLNSPHNPTGRLFAIEDLASVYDRVAATPHGYMLVDEIYRPVGMSSAVALGPRALVTDAVSKRWSLPGLRLGWMAGDPALLDRLRPVHEHATCCVSRPSEQWIEALWPRRLELFAANEAIAVRNRSLFTGWSSAAASLIRTKLPPIGVMTLAWPTGAEDDVTVARTLRERHGLFVLPGSTLGYPGALRLGFGHRDPMALLAALDRLEHGLEELRA